MDARGRRDAARPRSEFRLRHACLSPCKGHAMQPFVVNRHNRICFPSNFVPQLDLSVMWSLEQLDSVIRRDFEMKAPTGTDILHRVEDGAYASRYELMRDLA